MVQINDRIRSILQPLSHEEKAQLEENILANGCRDPLVLWNGTLIDGHNRYEICTKHGLPYNTVEIQLPDEEAVIAWVEDNQIGRRNLTPDWFRYLLGRKYARVKKAHGGTGANQHTEQRGQFDPSAKTAEKLADEYGVSERTVKRAEKFAEEVDLDPELKEAMLERKPVSKVKKQKEIEKAKQAVVRETVESVQSEVVLYQENALEFANRFKDQSIDLLLTDPPYSTDLDDVASFAVSWLPTFLQKVKSTGSAYIFIGAYPKEMKAYLNVVTPQHITLKQILVWTYRNTLGQTPKDRYKLNWQAVLYFSGVEAQDLNSPLTSEQWAVQDIPAPDGRQGDRYHKWQKPMEIAERFIRHTTNENDMVIDPFCGTGTMLLAASKLGRIGTGCDIEADALKIAKERGCTIIGV